MNVLFGPLAALERAADYHLRRHSLITANVANASTPGYRPQDLGFDAVLAQRTGAMRTTHARHLPLGASDSYRFQVFEDSTVTPGQTGNTVSMDREMAKLSANSVRYRAVIEMLNRRLGLIKYAATDGRG